MRFNSWKKEQILAALSRDRPVYELDTGSDGDDDVLIGTERQVLADVLSFIDVDELPAHWTLRRIFEDEIC